MLPYPVDSFGGPVAEIRGIEIAAEKKNKNHLLTISSFEAGSSFMASSFRRLFTLVKSPADFASMRTGKCGSFAFFGWITASTGILTVLPRP